MKKVISVCAMGIAFGFGGVIVFLAWLSGMLITFLPIIRNKKEERMRQNIHQLAHCWVSLMQSLGILYVDFGSLRTLRRRKGVMLVANHPTYLDALFFMSVTNNIFCLTKTGNMEKFWISLPARVAGYVDNGNPLRLVRNCVSRLRNGENLLVFPEGTRTSGTTIKEFKRGFSCTSIQSGASMILVYISSMNGPFLKKGEPFFALCPQLPIRYRFTILDEVIPSPGILSRELTHTVEERFKKATN